MKTHFIRSTFPCLCYLPERKTTPGRWLQRFALLIALLPPFGRCPHAQVASNSSPVISAIPDQVTDEDTPLIGIPFTIRDAETPSDQLLVSTRLDFNDGVLDQTSIVVEGTGTNRWLSIFPPPNKSGHAVARVTVRDAGQLSSTASFLVEVRPVNDRPLLGNVRDQIALRGQGLLSVPFTAFDLESAAKINLHAWSSRQQVVSNSALRLGLLTGISNRVLQVTLATNGAAGSTAITLQADDAEETNRAVFILTVVESDFASFAPTENLLPGVSGFEPAWGDFNGDGLMDVVVSPALICTNRGSGAFQPGIVLPAGAASAGAAPADFDGDGNLDLLLYQGTVRLLHNEGGDPPTFSPVDLPAGFPANSKFFWVDLDGDGDLDIIPSVIDPKAVWVRNDGRDGFSSWPFRLPGLHGATVFAVGDFDNDGDSDLLVGSPPTQADVVRVYENDGKGHFQDSGLRLPQGSYSGAGWVDLDGDGLLDLWVVQRFFESNPGRGIVLLRQSNGQFSETFRLNFPNVVPAPANTNLVWADFDNDGYVDLAGPYFIPEQLRVPATNYTTLYHNDGTGHFITSGLAATLEPGQVVVGAADVDDDGSADLLQRSGSILRPLRNQSMVSNRLPGAPSGLRSFVSGNQLTLFWNESSDGNQKAPLTYNVRIGTAPGANDVVPSMSTTNGARMTPAPGNAGFNRWMSVALPFNQLDVESLFWSVQAVDAGLQGGPFASEETVFIDLPGNTPPVIDGIADLTVPEDSSTNVDFYILDDRTPPDHLRVQVATSNPEIIDPVSLRLSGFTPTPQGLRVSLSLTARPEQSGAASITITATDRAGLSTDRFFLVQVVPVNDPPSISAPAKLLGVAGSDTQPLVIEVSDIESPAEQLVLTAHSLDPEILPDSHLTLRHLSGGDWTLVGTAVADLSATATVVLTVEDPGGASSSRTVAVQFQKQLFIPYLETAVPGALPYQLNWADFNGDHRMEILMNDYASGLTVRGLQSPLMTLLAWVYPRPEIVRAEDLGDFDNDGDLDVLVSVEVDSQGAIRRIPRIVRNLGGFRFERVTDAVFLPGTARFTDFDSDGRLDVAVMQSPTNLIVYHNRGSGFENGRNYPLRSALSVGESVDDFFMQDLDADGQDELVVTLHGGGIPWQTIFRWAGEEFEQVSPARTSDAPGLFADLNQDRLPDLIAGSPWGVSGTVVRSNAGNLNFIETGTVLPASSRLALLSADFDGDGGVDVLLQSGSTSSLYLNDGGFRFTPVEFPFAPTALFRAATADFDNDGMMDLAASLFLGGASGENGEKRFGVYRGQSQFTNVPPNPPTRLQVQAVSSNAVVLSWDAAVDPNQAGGLTYNVRVGTTAGAGDVLGPMSLPDGYRLLPRNGNAGWRTSRLLTGLEPGRSYYWTVQAVDNSFAGGAFAVEASFTMQAVTLGLLRVETGQVELELRTAIGTECGLEVSNNLKDWSNYPVTEAQTHVGTNGTSRISIDASGGRRFFRARPK